MSCGSGAVQKTMPQKPLAPGVLRISHWPSATSYSDLDYLLEQLMESGRVSVGLPDGKILMPRPTLFPQVYPVAERSNLPQYELERTVSSSGSRKSLQVRVLKDGETVASMQSPFHEDHGDCSAKAYHKSGWGETQFLREVFGITAVAEAKAPRLERWTASLLKTDEPPALHASKDIGTALTKAASCPETVVSRRAIAPYNAMLTMRPAEQTRFKHESSMLSVQTSENGWVDWRYPATKSPGQAFCVEGRVYSLVASNISTELFEFDAKTAVLTGLASLPALPGGSAASVAVEAVSRTANGWQVRLSGYSAGQARAFQLVLTPASTRQQ